MKNELQSEWNIFLQTLTGASFVREIQKGIDESLLLELKKSRHYSFKAEKIRKMTEHREKEWAEARRGELEMEKTFSELTGTSDFEMLSSVSHTKNIVVGVSCVLSKESGFQGIGVDIEDSSRKLEDEVVKRFMNSSDLVKYNDLRAIDFWVLKEAAFKATPKDMQLVVTSYDLTRWSEKTKTGVMQSKSARCDVKLLKSGQYSIGLSYFRF